MNTITLALAMLAAAPADTAPERYVLKTEETQSVTGVVRFEITAEKVQAVQWIAVAAIAPELPGQTHVKTVVSPSGVTATELSPLARKVSIMDVKANTTALKSKLPISVTYTATLRSRDLVALSEGEAAPKVPALSDKEAKLWLSEHGDCDYSLAVFDRWMKAEKLVRAEKESDLDYARRAFVTIASKFKYDFKPDLKRRSSFVCGAGMSDCAGLSALFVSLMRLQHIPARTLYGRWAISADPEKKLQGQPYAQWHVKAEFFAQGIGWVPVDLAGAILVDKTETGLQFFGKDKGDFLTMHIDPAITVDIKIAGREEIVSLQRPAFWVKGKGTIDGVTIKEDWQVR